MLDEYRNLFDRDLERLYKEIEAFTDGAHLWTKPGSIKNSAGNLCLHLIGNLNTFIGKNLGCSGYIRNREAEFNTPYLPKEELLRLVTGLRQTVDATLQLLNEQDLQKPYPENPLGYDMTTGFFLVHLLGHLNYHLGQISYLRCMQE